MKKELFCHEAVTKTVNVKNAGVVSYGISILQNGAETVRSDDKMPDREKVDRWYYF